MKYWSGHGLTGLSGSPALQEVLKGKTMFSRSISLEIREMAIYLWDFQSPIQTWLCYSHLWVYQPISPVPPYLHMQNQEVTSHVTHICYSMLKVP